MEKKKRHDEDALSKTKENVPGAKKKESDSPSNLPEGWVRRESKSRPGQIYFYHQKSAQSMWQVPEDGKVSSSRALSG